jgi:predicted DNA-binding protein YlxM (UPF0122 family)
MIYKTVNIGKIMEKLMKPAEYAKELGISRQAVYAKIKRGILTAKNVDGKLYIMVDNINKEKKTPVQETSVKPKTSTSVKSNSTSSQTVTKEYKALLDAKDETIAVLKGTVKDLKKSNKQISTTLRGEIDLLKDAFHEMRNLYVHQLEHKKSQEAIEVIEEDSVDVVEERWVSIKKFFKQFGVKKEKHQDKVEKRLKKAHKSGDDRLMKENGKLKLNINKTYKDIVK